MSTTKKVIIAIVVIIAIAGISFGAVWLGTNWDNITSQTDLYTYQDMLDYSNEKNQELQDELENYKLLYETAIQKMSEAEDDKNELTTQLAQVQSQLQEALNKQELDAETILELQTSIENLNNQIIEKNNQIIYYQELLEAYEDSDKLRVVFILVDNGTQTTYDVQVVDENGYLAEVVTPSGDFEGWALTIGGDYIEDLTTVQVTENMTIYGIFSNTVTYVVQGETSTEVIEYNGKITKTVELDGYDFLGWSLSENGEIISFDYVITKDTTFYAVLDKKPYTTVERMSWNGYTEFNGDDIWTDGVDIYYSNLTTQYVLNVSTHTWTEMLWNELTYFYGRHIWTDNVNIYYSDGSNNYVLDIDTHTWTEMLWNGYENLHGDCIWTDGTNVYYSRDFDMAQYILDIETHTWTEMTWNGYTEIDGQYIWTDGVNVYYSNLSSQYILDIETHTWTEMTWNGLSRPRAEYIWTDGTNIYYSSNTTGRIHYVLDIETHTWTEMTWNGATNFNGQFIWTDGINYYYSYGTTQFIFVS